jgi:hypothetical protein
MDVKGVPLVSRESHLNAKGVPLKVEGVPLESRESHLSTKGVPL